MTRLLDTKFNCNGEWLGLVDYINRVMGTPHTLREEECAVWNAIEQPVISIYRSGYGQLARNVPDYIRNEIAQVVGIVRQYTWLSEDAIWKIAYKILLWEAIPSEEEKK